MLSSHPGRVRKAPIPAWMEGSMYGPEVTVLSPVEDVYTGSPPDILKEPCGVYSTKDLPRTVSELLFRGADEERSKESLLLVLCCCGEVGREEAKEPSILAKSNCCKSSVGIAILPLILRCCPSVRWETPRSLHVLQTRKALRYLRLFWYKRTSKWVKYYRRMHNLSS